MTGPPSIPPPSPDTPRHNLDPIADAPYVRHDTPDDDATQPHTGPEFTRPEGPEHHVGRLAAGEAATEPLEPRTPPDSAPDGYKGFLTHFIFRFGGLDEVVDRALQQHRPGVDSPGSQAADSDPGTADPPKEQA